MPSLEEALEGTLSTPIHDALASGMDVLSGSQTVEFVPYVRTVLPLDGFVFWIRADLLPANKLAEAGLQTADPIVVTGSLHYASVGTQLSDENISIQKVDFAAQSPVTEFAQIAPTVLYVATWDTPLGSFQFTFNNRATYYQQADIHHYVGDAVYPVFRTQLINDISQFDQRQVVSNSMPLWLSLRSAIPYVSLITSDVVLFPAFLVPDNLPAPYGSVEITGTRAAQAVAWRGPDSSRWQLVSERVRLTFYGLRNDDVMDWLDYVVDRATNATDFGLMNMPAVVDDHRIQVELSVLAQKKIVDFDISYNQASMRNIARQLIREALIGDIFGSDHPLPKAPDQIIKPFMAPDDPIQPLQ